jgi:AcrR family transcriptional regulator
MKVQTDSKPSINVDARAGEIYQCAAELIVQKGFGHATIADIARKMEMTKAGLYYYISSKRDMLYRIMKYAMDVVESGIVQPTQAIVDPEQRLREIIRCHARELIKRGLTISVLLSEVNHLEPSQREKIMARKQAYVMFVQETIKQVQAQGKLRELPVELATQHLLSTLRGIAVWYPLATGVSPEEAVESAMTFILGGLLKQTDH